MKDNVIYRGIMSTFRQFRMMIDKHFTFVELCIFVLTLVGAMFLNLTFLPEPTVLAFLSRFLMWVFVIHLCVFAIRESMIRHRESAYRKRVSEVSATIENAEEKKPSDVEVNKKMGTTWKTNEDAYYQYKKDLERLKAGIQPFTSEDIVSEISVQEDISKMRSRVYDASQVMNDIFNQSYYQFNPMIEDWLMRYGFPTKESALEKVAFLSEALKELKDKRMAIKVGVEGELEVQRYLDDFKETLMPLYGIRFHSERGTVENDILLFTPQGIFSLEVKNIGKTGDKSVKISKDGLWYEWGYGDWKRSDRDKIFDQVNRQKALTEQFIANKFGQDDRFNVKNMIVIPNKNLEIHNESSFQIVRPNQIINLIRELPVILSKEEREELQKHFQNEDIGQAKFEQLDSEQLVTEIIRVYQALVEECDFLSEVFQIRDAYRENVEQQQFNQYLRLKYLNYDSKRSVI